MFCSCGCKGLQPSKSITAIKVLIGREKNLDDCSLNGKLPIASHQLKSVLISLKLPFFQVYR